MVLKSLLLKSAGQAKPWMNSCRHGGTDHWVLTHMFTLMPGMKRCAQGEKRVEKGQKGSSPPLAFRLLRRFYIMPANLPQDQPTQMTDKINDNIT